MMRVVEWSNTGTWDKFVLGAHDATIMHLYAWKAVMELAYGHQTFFLAALEGDEMRGILPLTLIRSQLFGRHLVSMPFMDYGGVCGGKNNKAEELLVGTARDIANRYRADLVLRNPRKADLDMPCSLEKVSMFLDLGTSEDGLWKRLPSERRNRIRKGQKQGLTVSFHGADGLGEFYNVFATNMRDLGSPVHSPDFFKEVLANLQDYTRIILVRYKEKTIGAGLLLLFNGMISIPWISSLRPFFDKCPNQILYWEVMRFGIAHGYRLLDFGRSSRDSGTFKAKRQWGAEPVQLYWHYYPENGRRPGEDVKQLAWGVNFWKRLPVGLANTVGPWLRRGIPN